MTVTYFATGPFRAALISDDLIDEEAREALEEEDPEIEEWLGRYFDTEPTVFDRFALELGSFKPWQWLTNIFLHADFWHLLGNMVFLWVFGQIVEGKLGWWRFLLVCLTIGFAEGALVQTTFLWHEPTLCLGFSGVINGLFVIAALWAPKNSIFFLLLWLPIVRTFELSVLTVGLIYIGLDVFGFLLGLLREFGVSTSLLHLVGAFVGLPIGVALLRHNVVDCEGWDWFSLRERNRIGGKRPRPEKAALEAPPEEEGDWEELDWESAEAHENLDPVAERESLFLRMQARVSEGEPARAIEDLEAYELRFGDCPLPRDLLIHLSAALLKDGQRGAAQLYLEELVQRFDDVPVGHRLALARLLIAEDRRPASGLEQLEAIDVERLPLQQQQVWKTLEEMARAQIDEGVLELDLDDDTD